MSDDAQFLREVTLSAHQWRGIEELAKALSDFEPLAKRSHLGQRVIDDLMQLGLAENGPPSPRYASYGIGYRLTELGWSVAERGRYARRS